MAEITSASAGRKPDTNKRSWHRKASRPVSGWLAALLIVAIVNRWIPQSRWLLVHMVTLGVATTSIMVWGQYFTEAILHNNLTEADRSRQVLRIRLLTSGLAHPSADGRHHRHLCRHGGGLAVGDGRRSGDRRLDAHLVRL